MRYWRRGRAGHGVGAVMVLAAVAGCSSGSGSLDLSGTAQATRGSSGSSAPRSGPSTPGVGVPGGSTGATVTAAADQLTVTLCGVNSQRVGGCVGGPVTGDQRRAVADRLHRLPEVTQVFYLSQEQTYQGYRKVHPQMSAELSPEQFPESFRVTLTDPAQASAVQDAVQDQPGVASVGRP